MAHFAELDENNIVKQVIVIDNLLLLNENNEEIEQFGIDYCQQIFGTDTVWIQTSYNASFRKNYAGIGYTYDGTRDAFIPPKPYDSWVLNEDTCLWEAPTPYPTDGLDYTWDESTVQWILVTTP